MTWRKIEGVNGHTEVDVMVGPAPATVMRFPAPPPLQAPPLEPASPRPAAAPADLRPPPLANSGTVEALVEEMLKAKTTARAGSDRAPYHLKDLRSRLGRFAKAFAGQPMAGISGEQIQDFLAAIDGTNRTRINYLRLIRSLYRFGIKRKALPRDIIDAVDFVEKPVVDPVEIEVFTPAEMREVLAHAKPGMIPFLAIGAFAGLRTEEIRRLDWSKVDLVDRIITIDAGKAKTASRRVAPISDNLAAWLQPHRQPQGRVLSYPNFTTQFDRMTERINRAREAPGAAGGFAWKHNGLRHSFISYRLALIGDAARVALEAGNSPQMIHAHYKALVKVADAQKWFSIMPN